jgi:uncharacterized protein YeaO (DUF488 family)
MVQIKRAYEAPEKSDGTRVLVDRLWPRGKTKAALKIDHWLKDLAPSNELRTWYGHEEAKWPEFQKRYREELKEPAAKEALTELTKLARQGPVTLVFSSKEEKLNNAVALAAVLKKRLR